MQNNRSLLVFFCRIIAGNHVVISDKLIFESGVFINDICVHNFSFQMGVC